MKKPIKIYLLSALVKTLFYRKLQFSNAKKRNGFVKANPHCLCN